jgi:hypothetical protein
VALTHVKIVPSTPDKEYARSEVFS